MSRSSDDLVKSAAHLTNALLPDSPRAVSHNALRGKEGSAGPYKTPFNSALRTQLGFFQWMELPENTVRLSDFGRAMTASRAWEVTENILDGTCRFASTVVTDA